MVRRSPSRQALSISVDEVLDLVSTGELPAVTYMEDSRLLVRRDSLDVAAWKSRRQRVRPD